MLFESKKIMCTTITLIPLSLERSIKQRIK